MSFLHGWFMGFNLARFYCLLVALVVIGLAGFSMALLGVNELIQSFLKFVMHKRVFQKVIPRF